jgi:hypothetical protein
MGVRGLASLKDTISYVMPISILLFLARKPLSELYIYDNCLKIPRLIWTIIENTRFNSYYPQFVSDVMQSPLLHCEPVYHCK